MGTQLDCIVTGNMVADIIGRPIGTLVAKHHAGHTKVDQIGLFTGGFACNTSSALVRLGVRVGVIGRVGNDEWKDALVRSLVDRGVDTRGVVTDPSGQTPATIVCVDPSGERTFYHTAGVYQNLGSEDLFQQSETLRSCRIVALGYYGIRCKLIDNLPEVLRRLRRETSAKILLETCSSVGPTLDELARSLPWLDYFVPSQHEATTLTGRQDPAEIVRVFRERGATGIVGVKLGADGCLLDDGSRCIRAPSIPAKTVVDTTGAGDSFIAGIIAAQIHGMDLEQTARFANAVGSCCVQALGASTGIRSFEETLAMIR